MKRNRKLVSLALMVVFTASLLGGCTKTSSPKEEESKPITESAETQADTATGKKVIVMGTDAGFPPFEFVADEGKGLVDKYDGVDVYVAKKIADDMGCELQIINMPFDSLIMALSSGKIDFIAAGMTVKPDREENVDFSEKYFKAVQNIIVKTDDTEITSAADLSGKTVGVVQGYSGDFVVTDDLENVKVIRYNHGLETVMELINGKLDAVVIDSLPAQMFVAEYPNDIKTIADDEVFGNEEYAIAVKKGNKELLDQINTAIIEMKKNGEIDKLVSEYSR